MMCTICGGAFVAEGLSVKDEPKRLSLGVGGLVVEVVKDVGKTPQERDDEAWTAAGLALTRQLRDAHRSGHLARPALTG